VLDVFLRDVRVGTLEAVGRRGRVRFRYAVEALDDDRVPALSLALPKRAEPYGDAHAGPFFRNLLPEQAYRRLIAAAAGTAPRDSLAMLGAIGGECPGAVSIWPPGERPTGPGDYRVLGVRELRALVTARDGAALGGAVARGRLSLPGVQQKIALRLGADGRWRLPLNGAITSHILKGVTAGGSEVAAFPALLENELFTLTLAARSGLRVAPAGLAEPEVRAVCVERFDRVGAPAGAANGPGHGGAPAEELRKLHQEDFCQILRVDPERKYEADGGPGLRACADAIRRHAALPARDLEWLARWVCYNYLVGNEDAHGKNLALVYRDQGLEVAPLYDLVSTEVYGGLERRLAMKIGAAVDGRNVQRSDWERFARWLGIPAAQVREWLLEQAEAVRVALGAARQECEREYGPSPVYDAIGRIAERQAGRLERELARPAR
jgi:serine/threonine-protein kinase HipA